MDHRYYSTKRMRPSLSQVSITAIKFTVSMITPKPLTIRRFFEHNSGLWGKSCVSYRLDRATSAVSWSEFLTADTEVPGSTPGATRFPEWH
jgi:hypothetical protein